MVVLVFATLIAAGTALIVIGVVALYVNVWLHDRAEMRENLRDMVNAGRWSDAPADFDVEHVGFTGSDTCYYRLSIPPHDVEGFLASVQHGYPKELPIQIVHGKFRGSTECSANWWRPQDEKELQLITWDIWSVAASKESGHVYIIRQGH